MQLYHRTVVPKTTVLDEVLLQEQIVALVRSFGLHRPDRTPCGRPVPVSEAHALMELAGGESLSQRDLALRLGLEKSTVSRLVSQLEERGWIDRARDPGDGRALQVRLTPAGRRAAEELGEARRAKFVRLLERIPEDEREHVRRGVEVLVEAMRAAR